MKFLPGTIEYEYEVPVQQYTERSTEQQQQQYTEQSFEGYNTVVVDGTVEQTFHGEQFQ